MAKMDPKKRKFLKHLGLLGFGALIGLGISHATSPSETTLINNWANSEIKTGRKIVWEDYEEIANNEKPLAKHEPREGGLPIFKENVCAYHIDDNGDGKYEASEEVKYCTMPCKDVCPVDAISKYKIEDSGKVVPEVNNGKCIGCQKCFKICGYNAYEWMNKR